MSRVRVFNQNEVVRNILSYLIPDFVEPKEAPFNSRPFPVTILLLVSKNISDVVRERMNTNRSRCLSYRDHYIESIPLIKWAESLGCNFHQDVPLTSFET